MVAGRSAMQSAPNARSVHRRPRCQANLPGLSRPAVTGVVYSAPPIALSAADPPASRAPTWSLYVRARLSGKLAPAAVKGSWLYVVCVVQLYPYTVSTAQLYDSDMTYEGHAMGHGQTSETQQKIAPARVTPQTFPLHCGFYTCTSGAGCFLNSPKS